MLEKNVICLKKAAFCGLGVLVNKAIKRTRINRYYIFINRVINNGLYAAALRLQYGDSAAKIRSRHGHEPDCGRLLGSHNMFTTLCYHSLTAFIYFHRHYSIIQSMLQNYSAENYRRDFNCAEGLQQNKCHQPVCDARIQHNNVSSVKWNIAYRCTFCSCPNKI